MLLLVINCIIWPADAEGWECKCFVVTLGLSFLFFFLSRSCHPATLEGRDHPSDYLIRLEPHWHLQAADRSVISGIRQETLRLTVVPLSLLCRDLEESQAASPCYPAGWTPQDSKVNTVNVRWCRKHSQIHQTCADCVAPTEERWHRQSSDAFSWLKSDAICRKCVECCCSANMICDESKKYVYWYSPESILSLGFCFSLQMQTPSSELTVDSGGGGDLLPIPLADQLTCMAI